MTCEEVGRYLHIYLDGEFAPEDRITFEDHLAACTVCRERVGAEAAFLKDFRAKLRSRPAPAHLRSHVTHELDALSDPSPIASSLRWLPMALAAGIVAVVAWQFASQSQPDPTNRGEATASAAVTNPAPQAAELTPGAHTASAAPRVRIPAMAVGHPLSPDSNARAERALRTLPADVRGEAGQIVGWLSARLAFRPRLPLTPASNLRLLGGRVTSVSGQSAALFQYERNGDRIAIAQWPAAPDTADRGALHVARSGASTVARFVAHGLHHVVVCELEPAQLSALVRRHFPR